MIFAYNFNYFKYDVFDYQKVVNLASFYAKTKTQTSHLFVRFHVDIQKNPYFCGGVSLTRPAPA